MIAIDRIFRIIGKIMLPFMKLFLCVYCTHIFLWLCGLIINYHSHDIANVCAKIFVNIIAGVLFIFLVYKLLIKGFFRSLKKVPNMLKNIFIKNFKN